MAEEKTTKQVNVNFEKDQDLLQALDEMVEEDVSDRSKFIRKLIMQEIRRRKGLPVTGRLTKKQNGRIAA
jgi:metal-responsive CopG/Arc/MetJ family transcriptional regulator